MASSTSGSDETISAINVTPLVDVVLVLLVVLMVTATYVASRAIPVDLPKSETGEASSAPLAVTLDRNDGLYLDGTAVTPEVLREKIRSARRRRADLRAVIAADGAVAHRRVVAVIDLLRQEKVVNFAINVSPGDLDALAR
jgi:biopolymer transport protein ExbD